MQEGNKLHSGQERTTISVVLCTYNGEAFLREQLDSILGQTLQADEIIIQDDNSTDSTMDILREYSKRFPHIKVYCNSVNMGINPNFFSAINKASGDYIAISDQDDIWEEYKLDLQMQLIGDKLLCGGRSTPFSTTGASVRVENREPNISLLRQIFIGVMSGHTILFKRELMEKLPDLSDFINTRYYDVILTMVASAYGSIVYTDKNLVKQRRYVEAATYTTPTDNTLSICNLWKYFLETKKFNSVLRPIIKERLIKTKRFLENIDSNSKVKSDAIFFIDLYCSSSVLDFIRMQLFCVRHYKDLFFSSKVNGFIGRMRAMYFPISLSTYYRYLLKH